MARGMVLTGAKCKLFLNEVQYKEVQLVTWTLDYGVQEIYGIDSPHPQELATTRASVTGSVRGIRITGSGGLQASVIRPKIQDILHTPYISMRIQERVTGEDLIYIPKIMITRESVTVPTKGVIKLSFDFKGTVALNPLDRG